VTRYLLDTNHLSAYLDGQTNLEARIEDALRRGDRVGVCLPVLCEYRAGIRLGRRFKRNLSRLQAALSVLRIWPLDEVTTKEFGDVFRELRTAGRILSQFDMLIAALARQRRFVVLTADQDFQHIKRLQVENWLK
jgi:tRNA(fMet)-specific endonuclease VapC